MFLMNAAETVFTKTLFPCLNRIVAFQLNMCNSQWNVVSYLYLSVWQGETSADTSRPQHNQSNKRGQSGKLKKMKKKYADQDEEERQLRLEILQSAQRVLMLITFQIKKGILLPTDQSWKPFLPSSWIVFRGIEDKDKKEKNQ